MGGRAALRWGRAGSRGAAVQESGDGGVARAALQGGDAGGGERPGERRCLRGDGGAGSVTTGACSTSRSRLGSTTRAALPAVPRALRRLRLRAFGASASAPTSGSASALGLGLGLGGLFLGDLARDARRAKRRRGATAWFPTADAQPSVPAWSGGAGAAGRARSSPRSTSGSRLRSSTGETVSVNPRPIGNPSGHVDQNLADGAALHGIVRARLSAPERTDAPATWSAHRPPAPRRRRRSPRAAPAAGIV